MKQCQATLICQGNSGERVSGKRCTDNAEPGDRFCWTHRKAFEAGLLPEARIVRVAS